MSSSTPRKPLPGLAALQVVVSTSLQTLTPADVFAGTVPAWPEISECVVSLAHSRSPTLSDLHRKALNSGGKHSVINRRRKKIRQRPRVLTFVLVIPGSPGGSGIQSVDLLPSIIIGLMRLVTILRDILAADARDFYFFTPWIPRSFASRAGISMNGSGTTAHS